MIAAEGLAAVGCMIGAYRRSDGAATDYGIASVTVALRDLGVTDDVWAGWIPRLGGCVPMWSGGRSLGM